MIFDTHAHYDDEAFDGDREELLSGLAAGGIGTVVNVGADMESTKTTIALTEKYPFIYGAAGVHPSSTAELDEEKFAELRVLAQSGKIVAIGEIGLDYYWEEPDHETQKKWFHRQLNLARELKLPVIIHSRDAAKDTLDIMKEEHSGEIGGVIHCFSYGKEMAAEYLKMGFYLGIGGVLTFKNAKNASGSSRDGAARPSGTRNRLPLPRSGSQPRQTQLLTEPAICGGKAGRNQEMYTGRDRPCD